MNRVVIDESFCKGCEICISQCPEKVLKITSKRNKKGYRLPVAAKPEACSGCRVCERICPDMAITVEVEKK